MVEDVVTTGGSVKEVMELINNNGGEVVAVACIVDRSAARLILKTFFSLLSMEINSYPSKIAPYARRKIPLIKPGSRNFVSKAKKIDLYHPLSMSLIDKGLTETVL